MMHNYMQLTLIQMLILTPSKYIHQYYAVLKK